jgi:hypothetical protein
MSMTITNGHVVLMAVAVMCLAIAAAVYLLAKGVRLLCDIGGDKRYVQDALWIARARARYGVTTAADDNILRRFGSPPEGK